LGFFCRNNEKFRRAGGKVDHIVTSYLIFDKYWIRDGGSYTWNCPQRHKCDTGEEYAVALNKRILTADFQEREALAIVKLLEREYWQRA
jgi:hypothetical protein